MKIAYEQLEFIDPMLRRLTAYVEDFWDDAVGGEPVVTSLFRPGDSGVHGQIPLRGIDLRLRDAVLGRTVAEAINEVWVYDWNRPNLKCALYHDVGQGAHLHLQVHPNTMRVHS